MSAPEPRRGREQGVRTSLLPIRGGYQVCFEPRDGSFEENPWFPDPPVPPPDRRCAVPFCRRRGSSDPRRRGLCERHFVPEPPSALARAEGVGGRGPPPSRPTPPAGLPGTFPARRGVPPGRVARVLEAVSAGAAGCPAARAAGRAPRGTRGAAGPHVVVVSLRDTTWPADHKDPGPRVSHATFTGRR